MHCGFCRAVDFDEGEGGVGGVGGSGGGGGEAAEELDEVGLGDGVVEFEEEEGLG